MSRLNQIADLPPDTGCPAPAQAPHSTTARQDNRPTAQPPDSTTARQHNRRVARRRPRRLLVRISPALAGGPRRTRATRETRTHDLLITSELLYRLS